MPAPMPELRFAADERRRLALAKARASCARAARSSASVQAGDAESLAGGVI